MENSTLFIILGLTLNIATFIALFFSAKQKNTNHIENALIGVNKAAVAYTFLLIAGFGFQLLGVLYKV